MGWWEADAPLTPQMYEEDKPLLEAIQWPDGVVLKSAVLWVNGREYRWRSVSAEMYR
jgi:hypothetical protein